MTLPTCILAIHSAATHFLPNLIDPQVVAEQTDRISSLLTSSGSLRSQDVLTESMRPECALPHP